MTQAEPRAGQRTEDEVKFFDQYVHTHGDYDVLGEGAYRQLLREFRRRVKPKPHERCVDLGCGTGAFTRRLSQFDLDLTGFDLSPQAVEFASRQAKREQYAVADIIATGRPSGSFDIVVYSGVLHHFPTEQDRREVLAEGYRLLAPGGRLFAFDPNQHSPSMWLYRDPRSPLFSDKGKTDNEVLLSRAQLRRELAAVGFSDVDVRGLSGISYRYVESAAARFILPLYNGYELMMHLSPFERILGTFVISVAHKR